MKGKRKTRSWKEPLANTDRASLNGFTRYWSQRETHFKDLYGTQFNKKRIREVFQDAMQINWKNLYHA